ncbi:MAG TPA: GH3 auxin-responsive promoter family protein [Flavobacteriales bacterium]|nr:GH3 auxin-responsive promoter family protein [Flavobacteriales bacterium]HIN40041.1 GH3 auxin-responsive promoter family protein [Flavobacteriales bacterium]
MALFNSILSWVMKKRVHQIDLFLKYPHDVQNEGLLKLLDKAKDTEWGKEHDYKSIRSFETYKERFPVQDYDSLKQYVIRLRQAEQNILWPSEIKWFSKSSGTTSDKSKLIPVSQEAMEECHFKAGKDILTIYCNNNPETEIFSGKGLTLGGSNQISNFNSESYYGDLSSILIQNAPYWVELIRTPERSIALMDEFEKKIKKIGKATLKENVTNIAGVPSWILVLLKDILEQTGKNNLLEIWPNLELFIHGGVNFGPYRKQFEALIPSAEMNYLETYSASEGFFGIQDLSDGDDMLLMLDYGIFYEFIPMEEVEKENPRTICLEQVELGKTYALVISTNAGLWRYKIGDTIKFTSLNPYKIKVAGRIKHFINAFGEELIIDNAEHAMKIACQKSDAIIDEFTAGPIYMNGNKSGAHEWLIEFVKPPDSLSFFAETLDNALKSINSDYEAKRAGNLTLGPPIVREMQKGVFFNWLKSKNKVGGQNKVPRLANDRKHLEEILKLDA